MEKNASVRKDSEVIDLLHVFKTLAKRSWAILLVMILVGALAFGYTTLFVKPKYSSHVKLYVNNSTSIGGKVEITAANLSAAQSLVDTYIVILNTKDTMEAVIDDLAASGTPVSYSPEKLLSMIRAEDVNNTEIFQITVTATDPFEAYSIAKSISNVMELRVPSIIDGAKSLEIVQEAEPNSSKVSPSLVKNTLVGVVVGFIVACAFIAFFAVLDDTIRNEDQVIEMYDLPILAKIPNLMATGKSYGTYGTYSEYQRYGKKEEKSSENVENATDVASADENVEEVNSIADENIANEGENAENETQSTSQTAKADESEENGGENNE